MNLSSYFGIIIAFALGYILGTITGKLLKYAIGFLIILGGLVGIYLYFLR